MALPAVTSPVVTRSGGLEEVAVPAGVAIQRTAAATPATLTHALSQMNQGLVLELRERLAEGSGEVAAPVGAFRE